MLTQPQVHFVKEKIMELQQALFFNESESLLRLPASVINALHVDEVGQVWFLVRRPAQQLNEFDKTFPGRLDFYKKGKSFYLHVSGKVSMITDPEEMNHITGILAVDILPAQTDMVLVKLAIKDIFYYPVKPLTPLSVKEGFKPSLQPSAFVKTLQYIVKDIIPVFQSH